MERKEANGRIDRYDLTPNPISRMCVGVSDRSQRLRSTKIGIIVGSETDGSPTITYTRDR